MKVNAQQTLALLPATLAITGMMYLVPIAGIEGRRALNVIVLTLGTCITFILLAFSFTDMRRARIIRLEYSGMLVLAVFIVTLYLMHLLSAGKVTELLKISSFVLLLVLASEKTLWQSFGYFRFAFALIVAPSIVLYFFNLLGTPPFGGFEVPTHEGKVESGMRYGNYLFGFMIFKGGESIHRLSALFDEPGVVGTYAAFLLAATRFKMDAQNVIIFIAAILSWSLAFIVLAVIYLLFARPRLLFILLLILGALVFLAADNPIVQKLLINRLLISDEGVSGDNRTTIWFDLKFIELLFSSKIYFGNTETAHQLGYYVSSWKTLIFDYGLAGLTSILLFIVMLFRLKKKKFGSPKDAKGCYVFLFMFLASIYQRPGVVDVAPLFILAAGVSFMVIESNKRELKLAVS